MEFLVGLFARIFKIYFLKLNFVSKVMPSSFPYSLSLIVELLMVTVALEHLLPNIMRYTCHHLVSSNCQKTIFQPRHHLFLVV